MPELSTIAKLQREQEMKRQRGAPIGRTSGRLEEIMKRLGVETRVSNEDSTAGCDGSKGLDRARVRVGLALLVLPEASVVHPAVYRDDRKIGEAVTQERKD